MPNPFNSDQNIPRIHIPELMDMGMSGSPMDTQGFGANPFAASRNGNPFGGMSNPRAGYQSPIPQPRPQGMTQSYQTPRAFGQVDAPNNGQYNRTASPLGVGGGVGSRISPIGGAGSGRPNPFAGMTPDEMKWAKLAQKAGLDWNTTKLVYMNPSRNGSPNPATALGRQMDDKAWGDSARAAGILTGNPDRDNQVWIDHYNAGGNWQADPMVGHNEAIDQYYRNQQSMKDAMQQPEQYPDWYTQ